MHGTWIAGPERTMWSTFSRMTVPLVLGLLWTTGLPHAAAADLTEAVCLGQKLRAVGDRQACNAKQAARAVLTQASESTRCEARFRSALDRINERASALGIPCRFRDLGNGTVLDLDTGLQWEKKGHLDGVMNRSDPHDADNDYSWGYDPHPDRDERRYGPPNGTAFTEFLGALNNCRIADNEEMTVQLAGFAGHCDWRLPTLDELRGIIDMNVDGCGAGRACIDPRLGPTPPATYWVVTAGPVPSNAWEVDFRWGLSFVDDEDSKAGHRLVRAVRGGW